MKQRLPEPVKLHEEVTKCPACGKNSLRVTVYLYEVPIVGTVTMTVGKCNECGFTFRDVRLAEEKPPRRIILEVENPDDLDALVVRAPSATVRVEGLVEEGPLEMKPGPIADGFITTVEGVLHRFKEVIDFLCNEPDVDRKKCEKVRRAVEEAIEGKRKFRLVLEDPEGVSAIASKKARIEPLLVRPEREEGEGEK